MGIGYTHAPASIAPLGATVPVVGTNPFTIAARGAGGSMILIDQSIPPDWAFGPDGEPTTDPDLPLKGSMIAPHAITVLWRRLMYIPIREPCIECLTAHRLREQGPRLPGVWAPILRSKA